MCKINIWRDQIVKTQKSKWLSMQNKLIKIVKFSVKKWDFPLISKSYSQVGAFVIY